MTADIVELNTLSVDANYGDVGTFSYKAFWSRVCRGKTAGSLVAVDDHP